MNHRAAPSEQRRTSKRTTRALCSTPGVWLALRWAALLLVGVVASGRRVAANESVDCAVAIAPSHISLAAGAATGTVSVTAGCALGVLPWAVCADLSNTPKCLPLELRHVVTGEGNSCEGVTLIDFMPLSLPGRAGAGDYREDIANGYQLPLCVGDWVRLDPVILWGVTRAALDDRLGGLPPYNCTASSSLPDNMRRALIPKVANLSYDGTQDVRIDGFYLVALDGNLNAQKAVSVTFLATLSAVPTNCSWTATNDVAWLTITAGASGEGNGTVSYAVAANPGPARSGTLTIAGQTFTVEQASLDDDPAADSDGDGMANGWEDANGFDKRDPTDAGEDADGDGMINLQEFQASTDPGLASDRLAISDSVCLANGRLKLSFASKLGKVYRAEAAMDLTGHTWTESAYSTTEDGVLQVGSLAGDGTTLTIYVEPTGPSSFYRIALAP